MQRVQDQLDADERQDRSQAVGQVDQSIQQAVKQEVQLAQTHQGECGRGEDDEDVLGQAEDCRDRVQGEEDVGTADGHHDQQHRGQDLLAVDLGEQLIAVVLVGGVEQFLGQTDDEVVRLVGLVVLLEQVACGQQQDQAEDVEDPGELVDQRRTDEDECGTGNQREHDAEQQHLLLVLAWHLEAGHDDQEDKQVVDREGLFGDVAGEVFGAHVHAAENEYDDAED